MDDSEYLARREVSKDLAALARTCKTFQNPALNALWRFQYHLFPALRCFPEDLWLASDDSDSFVAFRRPLVPADWERPMFYWNRIQSFQIEALNMNLISLEVCETLRICSPSQTPFPKLRQIQWFDPHPAPLPLFSMFLSPLLNSICLVLKESMTELSLLPALGVILYPALIEPESTRIAVHPEADAAILEHIARLPSLKSLTGDRSIPRFRSLEVLHLTFTTPEISTMIVGAVEHNRLALSHPHLPSPLPDSDETTRLYSTIASTRSYATLNSLTVEDDSNSLEIPDDDAFDSYVIRAETLRVLFSFTNLSGFDLDDEVVLDMARVWRRVEELRLAPAEKALSARANMRVTLVGIQAIAAHCLYLRKLELVFDASDVPRSAAQLPKPIFPSCQFASLQFHPQPPSRCSCLVYFRAWEESMPTAPVDGSRALLLGGGAGEQ
ncbi:hypothetical protein B0H13DRAFT_1897581 [Mycena leptocephala]|nr:hypothetical protein B0H13DRAFT_1897581 [Mycena leptocephala]